MVQLSAASLEATKAGISFGSSLQQHWLQHLLLTAHSACAQRCVTGWNSSISTIPCKDQSRSFKCGKNSFKIYSKSIKAWRVIGL